MEGKITIGWWAFAAMLIVQLPSLANAAEISYNQDGLPYLANGTSTSAIANINLDDLASYNVTEALVSTDFAYSNLVLNGNFTNGLGTSWVYAETDPQNRATSAFQAAGGDAEPGRWRFQLNDNSNTNGYNAVGNLTNDGVVWDGSAISEATLNLSFIKNWQNAAPTTNLMAVFLIRPDGSQVEVWSNATIYSSGAYERLSINVGLGNFTQAGIYRIRLFNYVITPRNGRPLVSNYWDQVSLTLVKPIYAYSFGALHNSSSISTPVNLNMVSEINVTLKFLASAASTPVIEIFNFFNGAWENTGCTPTSAIAANAWHTWSCIISSSPQDYISTDGSRKVGVRLYTPATDSSQAVFSEDWLAYKITYGQQQAFVNSDKAAYLTCGNVHYRAKFLDSEGQLYTPAITANVTISHGGSMLTQSIAVPVTGGILESLYPLGIDSVFGDYIIKVHSGAIGRKMFHIGEGSGDVWKMSLSLTPDQGKYSAGDAPSASLNVQNQKGEGINSLILNGNLLLLLDDAPYSPAISDHGNGTYSFDLLLAGLSANAPHQLRAIANSSGMNLTISRGFFIG